MGGGIDDRFGISSTLSPQQSPDLEKTQAELRQTFTAAEKFRRELEFLQKGGNPLDLQTGSAASVSVQSTSLTDQHLEQFVTSEAKGSFAVTASPHGDSVGSSGKLGGPSVCEPNSADNLVLFGADKKFHEVERKSVRPPTSNISPSKHYSLLDSGQIARESGDSAGLELPKKSYKRRIRSRQNRDGARSSSSDAALSRGGQSFFPFHHASRDVKGSVVATNQERNGLSSFNSKLKGSNNSVAIKNVVSNSRLDMELDGALAVETTLGRVSGPSSAVSDANASQNPRRNHHDQPLKSDTQESPHNMAFVEHESLEGVEQDNLVASRNPPCVDRQKAKNLPFSGQTNGFGTIEGERKSMRLDGICRAAISTKGLDSESSCTQTGLSLDVNNENELPASSININCNGTMKQILASNEVPGKEDDNLVKEKAGKILNIANNISDSCDRGHNEDGFVLKEEEGLKGSESAWQNELKNPVSAEGVKPDASLASETERKPSEVLGSNSFPQGGNATGTPQGSNGTSFLESTLPARGPTDVAEQSACSQNNLKFASKEHEESILEEARIIQAKRKRIAELSVSTLPLQNRQISHWDFVLEEMSWLANDFAQERLWKVTAAAQISRRVAFTSQVRYQQQNSAWKQKEVAQTLGRAVMEFWHTIQVKCKELELQYLQTNSKQGLQGYAMRFLEYNSTHAQYNATQVPPTPDLISDAGIIDIACEDNMIEENLVYTVPPGAIEAYRKSIESHLLQSEGTWSSTQEEVGTSGYDAVADNAFEEDDEARSCYLPGAFEVSRLSKATKKSRNNFKFYAGRSYEMGAGLPFMQSSEKNIGTQPSVLSGKRSGGSLNVPIPTKHVRTASRQRVPDPFNAGTSGYIQVPNRTDASSGDTNSFQDEQSTLHGGAQIPNNMEAESAGDYENQLQFDSVEVSDRPRKKKKARHPGSSFDHRWQLDSNFQNDQKDHSKRRLDAHQLDSNGSNGLYIQHNMKKLKMRQSSDNSYDNLTPMARSIPSPVTSQMSNMSNPKKFMELLARDRSRKSKTLKTPAGQPGSGNPWSLFEDQSLVVLVHDMGPNWELISDAINSTLQFKCVFRNSKECKERHKMLMDRNTGDGADSAEDSGSSQPYPSTLPGIPEGSARQLFQRLQGPMEEETLKSHFEKIIVIGQTQYYKTQNDNQDPKQLQHPHSSHTLALSQVSPNNLNGGPVLTPLQLCDAIASTPDVPPAGYRGAHSGGLPISDQANGSTVLPGSSSSSSVPGSPNVVLGNDFSSASVPPNPSVREGRYGMPRTGSLPKDDQQRRQQYNRMLSARNLQHASLSPGSHSGADRGVHMLPARNGIGVMSGMNRSMTMARPGFRGVASPSVMNSGSVLSSGMAMRNPANMHSRAGPGQGNSLLKPRDAMHLMRPNQDSDHQRQILPADLQMQQVSQGGSSQGVPQFASGMSSSFPNQAAQPPAQSYPPDHQQQAHPVSSQQPPHALGSNSHNRHGPPNHATNTSHPAFGVRIVKERQLQQQRALQQQQIATSNAMMPHSQPPKSQLPVSSPQNGTQIQSQSSLPVLHSPMGTPSMASMAQNGQKHPLLASHGLVRNPQTGGNQILKQQRESQQFQQPIRQQPQQRQQAQFQQQTKFMKGGGRGTMMPQNLPVDPSLPNGLSGDQSTAEKGEQQVAHHLLKSGQRNLYSGPSKLNPAIPANSKQSVSHSSISQPHQQKTYSSQMQVASSNTLQQLKPSHSADDSNHQNHAPSLVASSSTMPVMPSSNHQHLRPQPHPKLANLSKATTAKRMVNNRLVNSAEPPTNKLQAEQSMPFNNSQTSKTVPVPQASRTNATSSETPVDSSAGAPSCKISEPFCDSSGAKLGNTTQFGRNSMQMSPPQTSSAEANGEHSGTAVNRSMVYRKSSPDRLPNPVGHDVGVQWQQLPSS